MQSLEKWKFFNELMQVLRTLSTFTLVRHGSSKYLEPSTYENFQTCIH